MNIVFDNSKSMNEHSEFLDSEYKLDYLNIEDKILEPYDNTLYQFNDFKAPFFDLQSVHDEQVLGFQNMPKMNLEEEDLPFSTKFKSTCLLDDTHLNFTDAKNFEFENKLSFEQKNPTAEIIEEKYSENPMNDKLANLEGSENVQGLQTSPKIFCPIMSKPYIHPDQQEHDVTKNVPNKRKRGGPGLTRWGRDKDVLVFKTLQKL